VCDMLKRNGLITAKPLDRPPRAAQQRSQRPQ
jgi:hypothetical protein